MGNFQVVEDRSSQPMPVDRIMSLRVQTERRNTNFLRSIFEQVNSTTKRRKRRRLKFWREARIGPFTWFCQFISSWLKKCQALGTQNPKVKIWDQFLEETAFWILSLDFISCPQQSCLKDLGKLFKLFQFQSSESSYLKTRFHICENYD